ncbi:MAG: M81 family metallopeptidase [Thiotrichales bacterium]|nr:M81 family metallopeptidase [Thiotrichales bacterium]
MRIVIAMMKHETNTFSPIATDWARFEAWGAHTGEAVQRIFGATRMPIAAYMALARERGAEIVTPLAAEAMPSGPVREDAYERMAGLVCDAVAAGCDAALLDLHGAMVAEHVLDGEGELLRRVRAIAPDLPVAVTCDLHCNLTAAMVEHCTALIGYKTYPHVDMFEVAEQVGRVVLDAVDGRVNPVMSWGRVDLLSQTLCQGTDDEPMRSLIALCRAAEAREGVLAATIFGGFALADIPDAGNSAVVVTNGDRDLADTVRDRLLDRIWADREAFVYRHRPIEEALAEACAFKGGPVILLDHADNCGSGATQDVMTAIGAVMRAGLEDVIVGAVWDPEAVAKMREAGVGARIELDLGGRTDMPSIGEAGRPLRVSGTVRVLTDGRWIVRGPMYTGMRVDMGPSAVLDTGTMQIVIVSRHHEPWDLGVFTSMGIQPQHHRYILLKSRIHYRAGFGDLPKLTLTLDGTGVTTSNNDVLRYQRVRRPIYPLDRINRPQVKRAKGEALAG